MSLRVSVTVFIQWFVFQLRISMGTVAILHDHLFSGTKLPLFKTFLLIITLIVFVISSLDISLTFCYFDCKFFTSLPLYLNVYLKRNLDDSTCRLYSGFLPH